MDRKQLEKALAIINYRVEKSHNGLNDFIINHKGERTSFVVYGACIDIRRELFGSQFNGNVTLMMEEMTIHKIRTVKKIDGISLHINKRSAIAFYNHDIK